MIIKNRFKCISSSSSCRAASTDIPDPLSPLLPIIHRLWQVFRATSRILTELLYVCSSWLSFFCLAQIKMFSHSGQKLNIKAKRGARGVIVIVIGNGYGDTSSNPGRD